MSSNENKLIVVTGFGPFEGHEKVNASWEAVKLLPNELTHNGTVYQLEHCLVPVEYAAVDKAVEDIWQRQPELVVHVGVSGLTKNVLVEKIAYNNKFHRSDNAGQFLKKGVCCLVNHGNSVFLRTKLNVDKIVEAVNAKCKECTSPGEGEPVHIIEASKRVGSFLCGYIYLKSLDVDCKRSLFIHVPPVGMPLSSAQTSEIVLSIIEQCVQQLAECKC